MNYQPKRIDTMRYIKPIAVAMFILIAIGIASGQPWNNWQNSDPWGNSWDTPVWQGNSNYYNTPGYYMEQSHYNPYMPGTVGYGLYDWMWYNPIGYATNLDITYLPLINTW
jgi:hypothetical protein